MRVCAKCFNDYAIRSYIENNGTDGICEITGGHTKVIDTVDLSDSFDSLIASFTEIQSGRPFYAVLQDDWKIFNEEYGQQVFATLLKERDIDSPINIPVEYSDDIKLAINDWSSLKANLINNYRYLSIMDMNNHIFYDEAFAVHASTIKAGTILFRSRINENGSEVPIHKGFMSAPSKAFAAAGRANPQGIPFLYLSNNVETTFYETRAVFLDNISTGEFRAVKEIKLVDFTKHGSPFDSIYSESGVQNGIISEFITKEISSDLSRPMRRHDSVIDYVPTQFICEYIRYTTEAEGIAFKSSLSPNGINYVIFNPAFFECQDNVQVHKINKVTIEE